MNIWVRDIEAIGYYGGSLIEQWTAGSKAELSRVEIEREYADGLKKSIIVVETKNTFGTEEEAIDDTEARFLTYRSKIVAEVYDALGELAARRNQLGPESRLPANHPMAIKLRQMVYDALLLIVEKKVPNAIPGLGFTLSLQLPPKARASLGVAKVGRILCTNRVDGQPIEVWSVPAWHLLKLADKVDAEVAASWKPEGE